MAAKVLLMGCTVGCGGKDANDNIENSPVPRQNTFAIPLPQVPDSLTTIESRAAYATLHYWDGLDFNDEARSLDTLLMEQNFANFAALLSLTPGEDADKSVRMLLDKAQGAGRSQYDLVAYLAEKYLDEPNSPMRDECLYSRFLNAMVDGNALSDAEKIRPRHRLEQARKNRPGEIAADFKIHLREGSGTTLHRVAQQADTTLIIFYDPDCPQCNDVMRSIADIPLSAGVQVLAVDVETDRQLWDKTAPLLPQNWQVGFSVSAIIDDEIYYLPASPTIYVVDQASRIMLKDPSLQALGEFLFR